MTGLQDKCRFMAKSFLVQFWWKGLNLIKGAYPSLVLRESSSPLSCRFRFPLRPHPRGHTDALGPDNLLRYRYRGTDPWHRDNVGLRIAMQRRLPLAYFNGVVPGRYLVMWPVYVIGDYPDALAFSIAVDDVSQLDLYSQARQPDSGVAEARREYVTSLARRRLHQGAFRERVLRAYRHQCAFCRLRHSELLDAAHIIPDTEPEGEPVVRNGISLCRLHHAAFDRFFLGVRPDHIIEVRPDVLEESDGPTLQHVIQGLHGQPIILPRRISDQPAIEFLSQRYDRFLEVAHGEGHPRSTN